MQKETWGDHLETKTKILPLWTNGIEFEKSFNQWDKDKTSLELKGGGKCRLEGGNRKNPQIPRLLHMKTLCNPHLTLSNKTFGTEPGTRLTCNGCSFWLGILLEVYTSFTSSSQVKLDQRRRMEQEELNGNRQPLNLYCLKQRNGNGRWMTNDDGLVSVWMESDMTKRQAQKLSCEIHVALLMNLPRALLLFVSIDLWH